MNNDLIFRLIRIAPLENFFWRDSPQWARASSFTRFLAYTQRHTTVGRTPLAERSARRREVCLTTHNSHKRQTSMPSVGFEPTISAGERPQTYALDHVATGTGTCDPLLLFNKGEVPIKNHSCNPKKLLVILVYFWAKFETVSLGDLNCPSTTLMLEESSLLGCMMFVERVVPDVK